MGKGYVFVAIMLLILALESYSQMSLALDDTKELIYRTYPFDVIVRSKYYYDVTENLSIGVLAYRTDIFSILPISKIRVGIYYNDILLFSKEYDSSEFATSSEITYLQTTRIPIAGVYKIKVTPIVYIQQYQLELSKTKIKTIEVGFFKDITKHTNVFIDMIQDINMVTKSASSQMFSRIEFTRGLAISLQKIVDTYAEFNKKLYIKKTQYPLRFFITKFETYDVTRYNNIINALSSLSDLGVAYTTTDITSEDELIEYLGNPLEDGTFLVLTYPDKLYPSSFTPDSEYFNRYVELLKVRNRFIVTLDNFTSLKADPYNIEILNTFGVGITSDDISIVNTILEQSDFASEIVDRFDVSLPASYNSMASGYAIPRIADYYEFYTSHIYDIYPQHGLLRLPNTQSYLLMCSQDAFVLNILGVINLFVNDVFSIYNNIRSLVRIDTGALRTKIEEYTKKVEDIITSFSISDIINTAKNFTQTTLSMFMTKFANDLMNQSDVAVSSLNYMYDSINKQLNEILTEYVLSIQELLPEDIKQSQEYQNNRDYVLDKLRGIVGVIAGGVTGAVSGIIQRVVNVTQDIYSVSASYGYTRTRLGTRQTEILPSDVKEHIINSLMRVKELFTNITTALRETLLALINTTKEIISNFTKMIRNYIQIIVEIIETQVENLVNAVKEKVDELKQKIKEKLHELKEDMKTKSAIAGAIAGATVGFMAGGVVGALIGAGAGALLGYFGAEAISSSVERKLGEMSEQLANMIGEAVEEVVDLVRDITQRTFDIIDLIITQVTTVVDGMVMNVKAIIASVLEVIEGQMDTIFGFIDNIIAHIGELTDVVYQNLQGLLGTMSNITNRIMENVISPTMQMVMSSQMNITTMLSQNINQFISDLQFSVLIPALNQFNTKFMDMQKEMYAYFTELANKTAEIFTYFSEQFNMLANELANLQSYIVNYTTGLSNIYDKYLSGIMEFENMIENIDKFMNDTSNILDLIQNITLKLDYYSPALSYSMIHYVEKILNHLSDMARGLFSIQNVRLNTNNFNFTMSAFGKLVSLTSIEKKIDILPLGIIKDKLYLIVNTPKTFDTNEIFVRGITSRELREISISVGINILSLSLSSIRDNIVLAGIKLSSSPAIFYAEVSDVIYIEGYNEPVGELTVRFPIIVKYGEQIYLYLSY
ncbi:MAG: hypothetical protein Q6363_000785, partial [Candidatus Njordarchaeota archaeon]